MRRLNSKEVAGLCLLLGLCSAADTHACIPGVACTLAPVVIDSCPNCTQLSDNVNYVPPGSLGVLPSFVPVQPIYIPGGLLNNGPINDPNCGQTSVSAAGNSDMQNVTRTREGQGSVVGSETNKAYHHSFTNETGYVPPTNSGAASADSGATFCGVDVGQYWAWQFTNMGVASSTVADVTPYTVQKVCHGLVCVESHTLGANAQNLIANETQNASRNTISQAQCQAIFFNVFNTDESNLETWFNNSGTGVQFSSLPTQTQMAVMDYAFQNGDGYLGVTSTVAKDILALNWAGLEQYWSSLGDKRDALRAQGLMNDMLAHKLRTFGAPCPT